jgi:hypothetical protein
MFYREIITGILTDAGSMGGASLTYRGSHLPEFREYRPVLSYRAVNTFSRELSGPGVKNEMNPAINNHVGGPFRTMRM